MRGWGWVIAAGLVGLVGSGLFSAVLHLERDWFIAAFAALTLTFVAAFMALTGVRPGVQVRRRWPAGLLGGLLIGTVLAWTVQSQPASAGPTGGVLLGALLWQGVVYGTADALLLNVLPVLAIYGAQPPGRLAAFRGRVAAGGAALLAALAVTALYHVGYPEFRGPGLAAPLVGNGLLVIAYLLAGNPLAPVLGHVLMHAAAVLHGPATTVQLPPHY